jgi:hypothetical protein
MSVINLPPVTTAFTACVFVTGGTGKHYQLCYFFQEQSVVQMWIRIIYISDLSKGSDRHSNIPVGTDPEIHI